MVINEESADYSTWFKLLFLIPVALFIGAILSYFNQEPEAPLMLVIGGIIIAILFYFITPRKYQIFQDRIRIILGAPFGVNISYSTIREVRRAAGANALGLLWSTICYIN